METDRKIVLDTDIMISLLKGHPTTLNWFSSQENATFFLSSITLFELYVGAFRRLASKQIVFIDSLSTTFSIIELESSDMKFAAKMSADLLRAGKPLDYRDVFIATAALKHDMHLKTGNVSHFSRIAGLHLCD